MKRKILLEISIIVPWLLVLTFFTYDNYVSTEFWNDFYKVTESSILTYGTRLQNIACLTLGIVIIVVTSVQVLVQKNNFHVLFDQIVYVDKILQNEFCYDLQFELYAKYDLFTMNSHKD